MESSIDMSAAQAAVPEVRHHQQPERQQPQKQLLQAVWSPNQHYQPPLISFQEELKNLCSRVSPWRPINLSNTLPDAMDLLRDTDQLANIKDGIIDLAISEIFHIAQTWCMKWQTLPGLHSQRDYPAGDKSDHIQVFWTTVVAARALEGTVFLHYTVDSSGIALYYPDGYSSFSAWMYVPILLSHLLPQDAQPFSLQRSF